MTRKRRRQSPSINSINTATKRVRFGEGESYLRRGGAEIVPLNKKDFKKVQAMQVSNVRTTKNGKKRTNSSYKIPLDKSRVIYKRADPKKLTSRAQKILYREGLNDIKEQGTDQMIQRSMRNTMTKKEYDKWYYENYRKYGKKKKREKKEKKESSTSRSFSSIGRSVIRKGRGIYNRLFN